MGICLLLPVVAGGCAVHYWDPRTGAEQLWGLGQLRLQVQAAGSAGELAVVTSGCRVPGLCLDVGRKHFGLALGYVDRQQLLIVSTNRIGALEYPTNSLAGLFSRATNSRWTFGHVRLRTARQEQSAPALVTGRALAGMGAGFGGGDTSLSLALDTHQRARIGDSDLRLELDQDAPGWPGFDFFSAQVSADSVAASTSVEPSGKP